MKQLLSLSVFFTASGLSQATVTFLSSKLNLLNLRFLLNRNFKYPFNLSDKYVFKKNFQTIIKVILS